MTRWSGFGYVVGAVVLGALGGLVYVRFEKGRKALPNASQVRVQLVAVAPVELGTVRDEVTVVGTVEPLSRVDVRSKVSGRIDRLGVDENDVVVAGQTILAEIDRETYAAQLEQAQAAVAAAQAAVAMAAISMEQAEKDYKRAESLFAQGAVSEQMRDQARARHEAARSQKQASEAQLAQVLAALRLADIQYRESQIIAPVDGIVLKKYQDAGNMTAPTAPVPLFTVGEIREVKVSAGISERYIAALREGETEVVVCADAVPGFRCVTKLARVGAIVEPATRTARIEAVIPNENLELKPGMFVRMTVAVNERRDVPVLPAEAVVSNHTGQCVYVLEAQHAKRRNVVLGVRQGGVQEIVQGLEPNESVVVRGQHNLQDGAPVRLLDDGGQE